MKTSFGLHHKLLIMLALTLFFLVSCGMEKKGSEIAVVGKPAPVFDLIDITGKQWKLADLKGKVVFVNFWATWCSPCIEEIPSIDALNRMMPADYFQMVTILYKDRPDYAENLAQKAGVSFPVLLDGDSSVAQQYGLTGVPETFVIDPNGILREKFIGPRNWQSMDSVAMVEHYFPPSYKKIVE